MNVEEEMQQRKIAWLCRENRLHSQRYKIACALGRNIGLHPGANRLRIQYCCVWRCPRCIQRNFACHDVEVEHFLDDLHRYQGVSGGDGTRVDCTLPVTKLDVITGII